MKKRVLIPYASYGSGHKTIAEYIKKYLESNGDYECMTLDLFNYSIPVIGKISKDVGNFLLTKLPSIWSLLYFINNNRLSAYITKDIPLKIFKDKKLREDILKFNPDITIATHFLGTDLICKYNNKGITNSKVVTIVTDYKAHEFWLKNIKDIDAIIISSLEEKINLLKKGFKNKQIHTTGIPISPEMRDKLNRKELKKKYKIKNNKITVLFFAGGSNGATYNLIYIKELLKDKYDCNILFVAGKNKKAYKKVKEYINRYKSKNIKLFGFVTTINELYEISDFVITKPGGAQVTECLLFKKPMLLIKGNGGQEIENRLYLTKKGVAKFARNKANFNKNFKKLLEEDNLRKKISKNISKMEKDKSMEKLFKIVEKL